MPATAAPPAARSSLRRERVEGRDALWLDSAALLRLRLMLAPSKVIGSSSEGHVGGLPPCVEAASVAQRHRRVVVGRTLDAHFGGGLAVETRVGAKGGRRPGIGVAGGMAPADHLLHEPGGVG